MVITGKECAFSDDNNTRLLIEYAGRINMAQSIIKDLEGEIFRLQETLEFYAKIPGGDRAKAALAQRSWITKLKEDGKTQGE